MPFVVATHNGPFHTDDVVAYALLLEHYPQDEMQVVRTRDPAVLEAADLVFDVGTEFDPERRRFDHHQRDYTGPRSSAGMVLDWLEAEGHLEGALANRLRTQMMDYVDDVDNGARHPPEGIPCINWMVDNVGRGCSNHADFDAAYLRAVEMVRPALRGVARALEEERAAEDVVIAAMKKAEATGSNLLDLPRYVKWQPTYFAMGGERHPTEFTIFPDLSGKWRCVAIPPKLDSFAQKTPLPKEWAGLEGDDLVRVSGIEDAVFCHKNRFIAVFGSREGMLRGLRQTGLLRE